MEDKEAIYWSRFHPNCGFVPIMVDGIDILKRSEKIHHSSLILSKFMQGGQTSRTILPGLKERFRIMVIYYGLFHTMFNHIVLGFNLFFYYLKNRRI